MGFLDFLIDLVKGILGLALGAGLIFIGSAVAIESTAIGGIMVLGGFVALAFFVYNRSQMSQKYW